jgi:hypothetical protein
MLLNDNNTTSCTYKQPLEIGEQHERTHKTTMKKVLQNIILHT